MKRVFRINSGVLFLVILLPYFLSRFTEPFTLWGSVLTMMLYGAWLYGIAFFGAQQLEEGQKGKVNLQYLGIAILTVLAMIILSHFLPATTATWRILLGQIWLLVMIALCGYITFVIGRMIAILEEGPDVIVTDYIFTVIWLFTMLWGIFDVQPRMRKLLYPEKERVKRG